MQLRIDLRRVVDGDDRLAQSFQVKQILDVLLCWVEEHRQCARDKAHPSPYTPLLCLVAIEVRSSPLAMHELVAVRALDDVARLRRRHPHSLGNHRKRSQAGSLLARFNALTEGGANLLKAFFLQQAFKREETNSVGALIGASTRRPQPRRVRHARHYRTDRAQRAPPAAVSPPPTPATPCRCRRDVPALWPAAATC